MGNNNLSNQEVLKKGKNFIEQKISSLEEAKANHKLTNEQKLEYLSNLIQTVEKNVKTKDIKKY